MTVPSFAKPKAWPTAPAGPLPVRSLVASVALVVIAPLSLMGSGVAHAQSALDGIKQRGQIVIGYREDASPFSLVNAARQPIGYAVELCQLVAQSLATQLGVAPNAVKFLSVPVDQIERYMQGKTVDMLCSATSDTAERRRSMDFSAPIYIASLKVAVRRKDNIQSVAQLSGKAVAVIGKTTAEAALPRYASSQGLGFTVARSVSADAALGQLKLGWVAGYARDDVLLSSQLAALPDRADYALLPDSLSTEPIAIAFTRGDPAFAKLVNSTLAQAHRSGAWQGIYDKWFIKPIAPHGQSLNLPTSDALKASFAQLKP